MPNTVNPRSRSEANYFLPHTEGISIRKKNIKMPDLDNIALNDKVNCHLGTGIKGVVLWFPVTAVYIHAIHILFCQNILVSDLLKWWKSVYIFLKYNSKSLITSSRHSLICPELAFCRGPIVSALVPRQSHTPTAKSLHNLFLFPSKNLFHWALKKGLIVKVLNGNPKSVFLFLK